MLTVFILAGLAAVYFGNKNKPISSNQSIEAQGPGLPAVNRTGGFVDQGPGLPQTSDPSAEKATPNQEQYTGQSLNPLDYANGSGFVLGKQNEDSPYGPLQPVSYVNFSDDEAGKV